MQGMLEDEEGEERGVEDLDDGFWGSDSEVEEGEDIANSDEDIEVESSSEEAISYKSKKLVAISCPQTHSEFLNDLQGLSLLEQPIHVKAIIKAYQPKLAEGNKVKLANFSKVLLKHMIYLANQRYDKDLIKFDKTQNEFLIILKRLSEKYNQAISEVSREYILDIQERFKKQNFHALNNGDILFS